MVGNDTSLSSVIKLEHLISCLDGETARRVESLQLIGSNFSVTWETLTRSYDNHFVRLSAHMRKLLSMPPATSRSDTGITSLLDGVSPRDSTRPSEKTGRDVRGQGGSANL